MSLDFFWVLKLLSIPRAQEPRQLIKQSQPHKNEEKKIHLLINLLLFLHFIWRRITLTQTHIHIHLYIAYCSQNSHTRSHMIYACKEYCALLFPLFFILCCLQLKRKKKKIWRKWIVTRGQIKSLLFRCTCDTSTIYQRIDDVEDVNTVF